MPENRTARTAGAYTGPYLGKQNAIPLPNLLVCVLFVDVVFCHFTWYTVLFVAGIHSELILIASSTAS